MDVCSTDSTKCDLESDLIRATWSSYCQQFSQRTDPLMRYIRRLDLIESNVISRMKTQGANGLCSLSRSNIGSHFSSYSDVSGISVDSHTLWAAGVDLGIPFLHFCGKPRSLMTDPRSLPLIRSPKGWQVLPNRCQTCTFENTDVAASRSPIADRR